MASRRRPSAAAQKPRPRWLPDIFMSDRDALRIFFSVVADSIEESFRRNRVFFYGLQNMMVQLRRVNPMEFRGIYKIQSDFSRNAADHIEWLDSQVSDLERIYIAVQVRQAVREGVVPTPLVPRPRLPDKRTLMKIGKVFALWLRDGHGYAENSDNEKDKKKRTCKAGNIKKDTTKLPEDVVSSPKREQTVQQSEASAALRALVGAVGADVEAPPQEVRGANCEDSEERRQVRSGQEADEVQPPLSEGNESACDVLAECDKDSTSSSDSMSKWSTTAVVGGPPSSDGSSSPVNVNPASPNTSPFVAGSHDRSSNHSVKETGAEKEKESPSTAESRRRAPFKKSVNFRTAGVELTISFATETVASISCSPSATTSFYPQGWRKECNLFYTSKPTSRESGSEEGLRNMWRLVDRLLRMYYDHMRYTALVQLFLLKEGAERSPPARLLEHLHRTIDFMEEDLMHADCHLARISLFARMVDVANRWTGAREDGHPQLPPYPLIPGLTRPPLPPRYNCLQRIWRRCLCFFSRLRANSMPKQPKH